MKLKFSIEYVTMWGESLHVLLRYLSHDGTLRTVNLPMLTQDGQLWTVETAAVESRQHPVDSICYAYQVENQEGTVLRQEWTLVPRTYHFDTSKNYVFNDQWRERPLCFHLYTDAFLTTQHLPVSGQVEARRVPLYRKTLLFRVSAPQVLAGQAVALIGSHPALGNWNPTRYLKMDCIGLHEWLLTVNADAVITPIEYKYVVIDVKTHELLRWEEGDNRTVDLMPADGQVHIHYGEQLRLSEKVWRTAGVVIPVASLRSEHSFGVGDFGDLRRLVDWAVATGMKVIQTLPVNDTTTDGHWNDAHPYNIVSCFALHPHYLDLEQLGELSDKQRMTVYRRRQRELNALTYTDYEAVERVKNDYIAEAFAEQGEKLFASKEFKAWKEDNKYWLEPYAEWKASADGQDTADGHRQALACFTQYHLHCQLKGAADYARSQGIVIKGDVPIGVQRNSAETRQHPTLFNTDCQAGTPPDSDMPAGQNWGFPTYRWNEETTAWFHRRYQWMAQYFDAIRLDHVLAFFRTWEIPNDALYSCLGHFNPALPLTAEEIAYFGLTFRRELYTKPFVNDSVVTRLFGIHAQYVRDEFLVRRAYGLYDLKADYDTQRKVMAHFEGKGDENSLWIRDGLMRLLCNVLFVEDSQQKDMYHPRIGAWQDMAAEALAGSEEKEAYTRLYNHYFYQRHALFWGHGAMRRLTDTLRDTRMLVCAEDLGMLPDCVQPVLDALRILTLEVQTLPKQQGFEFAHLDGYPYRSVATFATHDMAPLRLWWEESPQRTQRYYVTMLQKEGRAPEHLPAHIAEEIIARHLYCPSMLCMLSLQDWLAMDSELRAANPRSERINTPADPYNRWQWRMHLTIEQLLKARHFNDKLKTMITRSKR